MTRADEVDVVEVLHEGKLIKVLYSWENKEEHGILHFKVGGFKVNIEVPRGVAVSVEELIKEHLT